MTSDQASAARPFEPIVTDRLVIRPPVGEDLDALIARRNDPQVARYQDWTLPHPPEKTAARLEATIEQGGLANDTWWMATVALGDDGTPIGDVAIGISSSWRAAEVGYSFDPAHWGQGYAAEALDVILEHLFDDHDIQRIAATLHPDNVASAMLLERAGFMFEGRTKLSCWVGDENTDDGLYGLTKADWQAWTTRPTGPAGDVKLIDVTSENQVAVSELVTHKSQERLVATVLESYADAMFADPGDGRKVEPHMWAIEADGELCGFVMIAEQNDDNPEPYLWRLLIDRRFQRRGIGSRAVDLVEEHSRSAGATSVRVCWDEGKGSPEPFYLGRGYVPTGNRPHGEVEARKQL